MKHYTWPCPFCEFIGKSRREMEKHRKETHVNCLFAPGRDCNYCGKYFRYRNNLIAHENHCPQNPNRVEWNIAHPQSAETRRRISETAKLHGKSGGYRRGAGRGKKGWYKGYFCDSSWELAFVIYNLEHGITNFTKNYTDKFRYSVDGVYHYYIPDFKFSDGTYVEIKGRRQTDPIIELKRSVVNNLQVLFANDMKPYLEYTINKYGKNYTYLYDECADK